MTLLRGTRARTGLRCRRRGENTAIRLLLRLSAGAALRANTPGTHPGTCSLRPPLNTSLRAWSHLSGMRRWASARRPLHAGREPGAGTGRVGESAVIVLAVTAALAMFARTTLRFGAEEFSFEEQNDDNWVHQNLTNRACRELWGDRPGEHPASSSLEWHTDYIDSYLYNPLFWAGGLGTADGLDRLKVATSLHDDLITLHFDDLTSAAQIQSMWTRYLSGCLAGMFWAAGRDDVPAAHNILGAALHAIQDFYAHSNWVDVPDRRTRAWHEVPVADRVDGLPLHRLVREAGAVEPASARQGLARVLPDAVDPRARRADGGRLRRDLPVEQADPVPDLRPVPRRGKRPHQRPRRPAPPQDGLPRSTRHSPGQFVAGRDRAPGSRDSRQRSGDRTTAIRVRQESRRALLGALAERRRHDPGSLSGHGRVLGQGDGLQHLRPAPRPVRGLLPVAAAVPRPRPVPAH